MPKLRQIIYFHRAQLWHCIRFLFIHTILAWYLWSSDLTVTIPIIAPQLRHLISISSENLANFFPFYFKTLHPKLFTNLGQHARIIYLYRAQNYFPSLVGYLHMG